MYLSFESLNVQSTIVHEKVGFQTVKSLPDDQWALEIENWFKTQLLTMQAYITNFVTGWQEVSLDNMITPPPETDMWMCEAQIIRRKDCASLSILGLSIIISVGSLIIIANMSITWIVNRMRPATAQQLYKKESWRVNHLLELQTATAETLHRRSSKYAME